MATLPTRQRTRGGRRRPVGQIDSGRVQQVRPPRDPGVNVPISSVGFEAAQGLERLGQAGQEQALRTQAADRKLELAQADARTQIQATSLWNQLVSERDPDTFTEKLQSGLEEIREAQSQRFADEATQRIYETGFARFQGDILSKAQNTARKIDIENKFVQTEDLIDTLMQEADNALASGDNDTRTALARQIGNIVEAAEDAGFYTPEQASAKTMQIGRDFVRGRVQFLLNNDPIAAMQFIEGTTTVQPDGTTKRESPADILPLEEQQKLMRVAENAFFRGLDRRHTLDERRRKEDERLLKKEQEDNYQQHLIQANRGELDLEQIERDLRDNNISSAHFNSLTNIDQQADIRLSTERKVDYEDDFRRLEDFGETPLGLGGVTKDEMISTLREDINNDQSLTANDKLQMETRLQNIENNTQITETQNYKNANRLINEGFGQPQDTLDQGARERAVAARYEFQRRVFEFGENPMEVAVELLKREKEMFKDLTSPFAQSMIRTEMAGIPKFLQAGEPASVDTPDVIVPSVVGMRGNIRKAVLEGRITSAEAAQYSRRLDVLESVIGVEGIDLKADVLAKQPKEEPEPVEGPSIVDQVKDAVRGMLMEQGGIGESTSGNRPAPQAQQEEGTPESKGFDLGGRPTGREEDTVEELNAQMEALPEGPLRDRVEEELRRRGELGAVELDESELQPQFGEFQEVTPTLTNTNPLPTGRPIDNKIVTAMEEAGATHGINPAFLKAIAAQESGFNPKAKTDVNGGTAIGLMQVTDAAAEEAGLDPDKSRTGIKKNVNAGAKYLDVLFNRVKDAGIEDSQSQAILAVAAYHVGPTKIVNAINAAQKINKTPTATQVIQAITPEESKVAAVEYLKKINQHMSEINKEGKDG